MIDYQKHIGIYKLHGINSKSILYQLDHQEWYSLVFFYWFVCLITDFMIGYNGNNHWILLKYEGLLFLILLDLYVWNNPIRFLNLKELTEFKVNTNCSLQVYSPLENLTFLDFLE